jgi:hypothetical protein
VGSRWQAGDFSGRRVEARHSIIVAGDGLAIDDAGRERNLAKDSTIKGKRLCQVVARPAVERTRSPSLRATTRKPSCLISCSQSGTKRRNRLCKWRGSSAVQKTDQRHRSLLRARRQRPRCRRAAEQRYELAAFHCPMPPVLPTERIAHLSRAEDCCAAGFQSGLCRFRVMSALSAMSAARPLAPQYSP